MTSKILEKISEKHPLQRIDAGKFSKLKVSGMTFNVETYYAEGLGQVSVMKAKGMLGLMKMDTIIINPIEIDLPIYSYDRIFVASNDTLIVELYDTLLGEYNEDGMNIAKSAFAGIPERDAGEHWYDSIKLGCSISKIGKKKDTISLDALALSHFEAYLDSSAAPVSDRIGKQQKASAYVYGLLQNGGPSTDVFKKKLGVSATEELYKKILFGIE